MQPLSRTKRISMLVVLVTLFLIGAPGLVLYSTGYRFGDAFSLVKTGGIFIHSSLSGTEVFIDDEFIENNGVILRNTLIQDLKPNIVHKVFVAKKGYHTWVKELFVFPNLVTEASILMLPTEIETRKINPSLGTIASSISTTTANASILENPEYKIVEEEFASTVQQFEIELSTTTLNAKYDVDDLPGRFISATTSSLVRPKEITIKYATTTFPEFILDLETEVGDITEKIELKEKQKMLTWLEGGDVHVRWAGEEETIPFIFCVDECVSEIVVSLDTNIEKYDFLPGRNDVLIVQTLNDIFAIEIDNRSEPNIQPIFQGNDLDFKVLNNNDIFVKEGDVFYEILL